MAENVDVKSSDSSDSNVKISQIGAIVDDAFNIILGLFGEESPTVRKQRAVQEHQFKKTFNENLRRYGRDFAMKEMQLRKQWDADAIEQALKQSVTRENLRGSALGRQEKQLDMAEEAKKRKIAASFAKGFQDSLKNKFKATKTTVLDKEV